jgi:uncharacterized membrane protein
MGFTIIRGGAMYPKSRIDALTDGLFGVAMTILVLDLRLPESFDPDQAGLIHALADLWPKFFPYALSFYILGATWLANIKIRSKGEMLSRTYATWWLLYLLVVTCLPFSASVVGRFAHLAPAVWLYSLNMAALAAIGYRLLLLLPDVADDEHTRDRKFSLSLVIATSVVCVLLSMISPTKALWSFVPNFVGPQLARWIATTRARRRRLAPDVPRDG